jgi:ribosomal protein L32
MGNYSRTSHNVFEEFAVTAHLFAFFIISSYTALYMVVRMRHTRAHTANRRSHHALKGNTITLDKETGAPSLRHRVSRATGKYRGKQVINLVDRVTKAQAKKEAGTKKAAPKKAAKKAAKKKVAAKKSTAKKA